MNTKCQYQAPWIRQFGSTVRPPAPERAAALVATSWRMPFGDGEEWKANVAAFGFGRVAHGH